LRTWSRGERVDESSNIVIGAWRSFIVLAATIRRVVRGVAQALCHRTDCVGGGRDCRS
jgi:hypothetical protein